MYVSGKNSSQRTGSTSTATFARGRRRSRGRGKLPDGSGRAGHRLAQARRVVKSQEDVELNAESDGLAENVMLSGIVADGEAHHAERELLAPVRFLWEATDPSSRFPRKQCSLMSITAIAAGPCIGMSACSQAERYRRNNN